MFKYLFVAFTLLSVNSCKLNKKISFDQNKEINGIELEAVITAEKYLSQITEAALKENLYAFVADSMEGRATGTIGQQKAANFLKQAYIEMQVSSPLDLHYEQVIPKHFFNNRSLQSASNVMAYIEGTEKPNEIIIISAHYDHLGVDSTGKVHNGADDDGSGTVAILEIAKAFKNATDDGLKPKRTILFLHVVGEEIGLYGSRYYVENPIFPLSNTVANLNIDMIGRVDDYHCDIPNYLYIIGSDRLSKELHLINQSVNKNLGNLDLDYRFNAENEPNRFYYRSDHYNFAKNNIPVIFYFNGTHDDYHQITDTADKINFELLKKRTDHIFLTAWELANRNERIKLD